MLRIFCYFHFKVEVSVSAGVTLIDVLLRCAAVAFCCVVPSLSFVLFVLFSFIRDYHTTAKQKSSNVDSEHLLCVLDRPAKRVIG